MKAPITSAQAMLHPTVVETVNALGKIADELRTRNNLLVEALVEAKISLEWYQEHHPDSVDHSDKVVMTLIEEALDPPPVDQK